MAGDPGRQGMSLIPADELASLRKRRTCSASPKNAARLLSAIARSTGRKTPAVEPDELRRPLGIDKKR